MTRRDFLNGTLLASGAALVSAACPFQLMAADDWNGTPGIGDYADANGNTHQVMADGHTIRDHAFDRAPASIEDTGETFDCVIVGGGISGLAAALFYQRATSAKRSCLVLENHPIFGGEAKRNEFNVDGQRLIASQGSAMWFQPMPGSFLEHFYDSVGIDPRQFQYQRETSGIATGVTPYAGDGSNFGFFFAADAAHPNGSWLIDPWTKKLEGAPISPEAKRELLAMRETPDHRPTPRRHGDAVARQLDAITLEDDLMMRHGLSRETIRRYLSPVSGGGSGIGADALSAYSDYAPDLLFPWEKEHGPQMFPGGNTGVARHMVKALLPAAIPGPATMAGICQARVDFAALDQPKQRTRIRLRSTVISMEHEGDAARSGHVNSGHVNIVYLRDGRLDRVRARSVILANGNWTINSIVRDLPAEYRHAYAQFFRAPCIMANVAVRNWRFLAKMGISQCQWFDGIGNYMAVRRVATFGGGAPAFSADSPTVLTLKILFAKPGRSLPEQVNTGRYQMMTTPFSLYEKKVREQFSNMFGGHGFDGRREIAGIILNRWGHAYLAPQPGFFFGKDGKPGPAELMRRHPFGRIAFANSDLSGIMDHRASITEAHRAVQQTLALA
jgi:spermidine dehydrogenase